MDDYFRFSKNLGFWVFLVHPTVVLVLLSASVERCFVSRMRDFILIILKIYKIIYIRYKIRPQEMFLSGNFFVQMALEMSE